MSLNTLFEPLIYLVILIPFFIWAQRSNKKSFSFLIVGCFIAVYLINEIITSSLSGMTVFRGQQYNWVGKGVAFIFLLVCAYVIPSFNSTQFGLTGKIKWKGAWLILIICAVYLVFRAGLYVSSGSVSGTIHPETVLFQATLPGLQEELLYRGILMGLLNRIFTSPKWKLINVPFGWAALITSILFGLAHGLNVGPHYFHLDYFNFFRTAFEGFLFALLTEKTKSIFPAVIFHNVLNLISNH